MSWGILISFVVLIKFSAFLIDIIKCTIFQLTKFQFSRFHGDYTAEAFCCSKYHLAICVIPVLISTWGKNSSIALAFSVEANE